MQCPSEIAEILCEILTTGLLRIRALGWNQNPGRCALEADHLHNLPALLADFRPELLEFYWNVSRISYIQQCSPKETGFEPLWKALGEHIGPGQEVVAGPRNP